jgi:hypothetical protein
VSLHRKRPFVGSDDSSVRSADKKLSNASKLRAEALSRRKSSPYSTVVMIASSFSAGEPRAGCDETKFVIRIRHPAMPERPETLTYEPKHES